MSNRTNEHQELIDALWLALKMHEPKRAAGLIVSRTDYDTLYFLGATGGAPAISHREVTPDVFQLTFQDVPLYPSSLVPRGKIGIIESFREVG